MTVEAWSRPWSVESRPSPGASSHVKPWGQVNKYGNKEFLAIHVIKRLTKKYFVDILQVFVSIIRKGIDIPISKFTEIFH